MHRAPMGFVAGDWWPGSIRGVNSPEIEQRRGATGMLTYFEVRWMAWTTWMLLNLEGGVRGKESSAMQCARV